MPIANAPSNASTVVASAMPVLFNTLTFAIAGTQFTGRLTADGLPTLNVWLRQTGGAGIVTVIPQFADGVLAGAPDWQSIVAPYGIVVGVSSLNQFSLGARAYRLAVTSTGVAVVRFRMVGIL